MNDREAKILDAQMERARKHHDKYRKGGKMLETMATRVMADVDLMVRDLMRENMRLREALEMILDRADIVRPEIARIASEALGREVVRNSERGTE